MNFGFFTTFWTMVAVRINDATQQIIGALMGYVGIKFQLCVVAYFIVTMLIAAWSAEPDAFNRFFRQLFLAFVIYTLASTAAAFNVYVSGAVNGLISGITSAIAGIFGGTGTVTAGSFDVIATKIFAVGAGVFNGLAWYSPKAWILGLSIILFWVIAESAVIIIFVVYLLSVVATNFVVAFGPLFIALYFFPMTRFLFDGWFRCTVAGILTQVFTIGWLALFITSLGTLVQTIAAAAHGGDGVNDIATQIMMLILGAALVSIFSIMTSFSAVLAIRISGGAHAQMGRMHVPGWSGGSGSGGGGPRGPMHPSIAADKGGDGGGGGPAPSGPPRDYVFNRSVGSAT